MTDKIGNLSNHVDRDPDELADLIKAIEGAGYLVEGPKSIDRPGIDGSDLNDYYWVIREDSP